MVLTELDDGFLVEAGSQEGARLLLTLATEPALDANRAAAAAGVASARATMAGQGVAADGLATRLMDRLDSPRWIEVADRCLACANCTMVCPTCFCTSVGAALTSTEPSPRPSGTGTRVLQRRLRQSRGKACRGGRTARSAVAHAQVRHSARAVRHVGLRRVRAVHHVVPGRHRRSRGARRHRSTVRSAGSTHAPGALARRPRAAAAHQRAAQPPASPSAGPKRSLPPWPGWGPRLPTRPPCAWSPATRRPRAQPGQFVMVHQPGFRRFRSRSRESPTDCCGSPFAPPDRRPGGRAPEPGGGGPPRTAGRGMAARARDGPRCRHRRGRHRAGAAATRDRRAAAQAGAVRVRPPRVRRTDTAGSALHRRAGRMAARRAGRRRDRRPGRRRLARPGRRRDPVARPPRLARAPGGRLPVRAGTDDDCRGQRTSHGRDHPTPNLRIARTPHGLRHRHLRPLPDGPVLRLP